jgi:superfamily I DNA/RNA helicase
MAHVDRKQWKPVGVADLEPAADDAVRSVRNTLVTAGPGAGKTELLAQRGCFLLETEMCPPPYRVLAVSLKVDAAANLRKRIQARLGSESRRFLSITLDAFAKNLVQRFSAGLPPPWQPGIRLVPRLRDPRDAEIGDFLQGLVVPSDLGRIEAIQRNRFYSRFVVGTAIRSPDATPSSLEEWAAREYWRLALEGSRSGRATLTFRMIARLADFSLRCNPRIVSALQDAHPFVLLDEFQDMTAVHYDLLKTAFLGSSSVLTAVGDTKQRIMVWAGAFPRITQDFVNTFDAQALTLVRNYRAAPHLVQVLNALSRYVEEGSVEVEAHARLQCEGVCEILEFTAAEREAEHVADMILSAQAAGVPPGDMSVIVRQRTPVMIRLLQDAASSRGLRVRDEGPYQDICDEPAMALVLSALRLATKRRDPEAWTRLLDLSSALVAVGTLGRAAEPEQMSSMLRNVAEDRLAADPTDSEEVCTVLWDVLDVVGRAALQGAFPKYNDGSWLDEVIRRGSELLSEERTRAENWAGAVACFEGEGVIPAMTIHKSKGLEYHTVFFLGLEDSSWWAFERSADEERRAFFVAFSRAKERVFFTFTRTRNDSGRGEQRQTRRGIRTLYEALAEAGIGTKVIAIP